MCNITDMNRGSLLGACGYSSPINASMAEYASNQAALKARQASSSGGSSSGYSGGSGSSAGAGQVLGWLGGAAACVIGLCVVIANGPPHPSAAVVEPYRPIVSAVAPAWEPKWVGDRLTFVPTHAAHARHPVRERHAAVAQPRRALYASMPIGWPYRPISEPAHVWRVR